MYFLKILLTIKHVPVGGSLCVCAWERNGERKGQIASGTMERLRGNQLGLGRLEQWAEKPTVR